MAEKVEIDLIVEAISKGFDKIEKDLKGVGTAAKESGDKAKQGSEGTKSFGTSLASLKTAAMGAAVVVGGALVAGLAKSIMAASDAEESMSKFNVVFKDLEGGPSALAAEIDIMAAATGRSKNELYGMVAGLGDLFQPLGFGVDAAADLSMQMTQLAIDLSSFNNMSMDEALQRLQGTLIGSHENALAFGVVINENTLKAEMAANGTDKLTGAQLEQAKVQARLNLLMAGTTAAQGDAERTADGFANQVRALQADMQDLAVEVGEQLLPAATELIGALRILATEAAPAVTSAVGFMASGLKVATDLAVGYEAEVSSIAQTHIESAKSTEDLANAFHNFATSLTGSQKTWQRILGTEDDAKRGLAEIATELAKSTGSYEEFNAIISETPGEFGAMVLALGEVNGELDINTEAWYANIKAAQFSAQSDEILTRGLTTQAPAIESNTAAIEENTAATERATRPNEDLADKTAQLAAQEAALDPAVRAANLALEQQTQAIDENVIALEEMNRKSGEYFMAAVNAGDGAGFFNESLEDLGTQTVAIVDTTNMNVEAMALLQKEYAKAEKAVMEYELGIKGANLSDEERNTAIAEQRDLMAQYQGQMSGMAGVVTGYAEVSTQATINQNAVNQALVDSIAAAGGSAEEIGAAALALGTMTEAQVEAAIKAAELQIRIDGVRQAYLDGTISADDLTVAIQEQVNIVNDMSMAVDAGTGSVSLLGDELSATSGHFVNVTDKVQALIDRLNSIPGQIPVEIVVTGDVPRASGGYQDLGSGGGANSGGGGGAYQPMASGGLVTGGTPGRDSVPAMLMPGERVLSVSDNRMFEQLLTTLSQQRGKTMNVSNNFNGPTQPGMVMREMEIVQAMMGI